MKQQLKLISDRWLPWIMSRCISSKHSKVVLSKQRMSIWKDNHKHSQTTQTMNSLLLCFSSFLEYPISTKELERFVRLNHPQFHLVFLCQSQSIVYSFGLVKTFTRATWMKQPSTTKVCLSLKNCLQSLSLFMSKL